MFRQRGLRRKTAGGFGLIELLVVTLLLVFIGGGLAYFYLGKGGGKPGEPRKQTPITKAYDTSCKVNLDQIRTNIKFIHEGDEEQKFPQSLNELKFPADSLACPEGHEPYQYDPATGQVHCPHPGHENF